MPGKPKPRICKAQHLQLAAAHLVLRNSLRIQRDHVVSGTHHHRPRLHHASRRFDAGRRGCQYRGLTQEYYTQARGQPRCDSWDRLPRFDSKIDRAAEHGLHLLIHNFTAASARGSAAQNLAALAHLGLEKSLEDGYGFRPAGRHPQAPLQNRKFGLLEPVLPKWRRCGGRETMPCRAPGPSPTRSRSCAPMPHLTESRGQ